MLSMISLMLQSTILMANFFTICASSRMIRDAFRSNFMIPSYFEKPQKSMSLGFNGKTNCECVVRPPSSITAATPNVAVANDIKCLDLTYASNAR